MVGRIFFIVLTVALAGLAAWLYFDDGKGGQGQRGFGGAVTVITDKAADRQFVDLVEALGTARARESVTITSPVTDIVTAVHFQDGQFVKEGDLLISLVADEEEAALDEAQGNVREAELNFRRIEGLVARGNASNASLDEARRRLAEVKSRLAASEARLRDRQIRAPFSGVLGLRQVSEGSLLTQSTPITTLDAIDVIKLDFAVPERFIPALSAGQSVAASVEAYPGYSFVGKVSTVDSRVDPATRSVTVRAEMPNDELKLRPGMLMTVEVTSRVWNNLAVPEESVLAASGQNYVFVVNGSDVERRDVDLGTRRPGYVEVVGGLEAGEQVVTRGVHRLGRRGLKVRVLNDDTGTRLADEDGSKLANKEAGKRGATSGGSNATSVGSR